VRFSWLIHLVSGFVTYKDQKLDWQVRVAWKNINVPQVDEKIVDAEEKVEDKVEEKAEENVETVVEKIAIKEESKNIEKSPKTAKTKKRAKKKISIAEKIRCSIQKIFDKIKEINALKEKIISYLKTETHKKAFKKFLKEVARILKKLKPKIMKANIEFGFEDPYTTGCILAYASMLYPFYGDNIVIKPNFEEAIMKGDIYLKGRIRISYFVNIGIRLIVNKNVRMTIKDTMKLIAKK